MPKKLLSRSVVLLAALLLCTAPTLLAQAGRPPNILLVIADDCTRFDLGCYGSTDSKTPTIDRLAAQGMRFTNCYQAAPICSPTRHNLYTGMYPTRTGAYPNHTFANPSALSMVQRLKPLGYRVALTGKRHIGPASVFPFEYLDNDSGDGDGPPPDFNAVDRFMGDAVAGNKPFCVVMASHLPHSEWNKGNQSLFDENKITLPPHYVDNAATRINFRNYLAEINALDGQVQNALALLDKHQIVNNTVVFFTSEQGTSMPFSKWTCYNAGLGTAMIVRWPGTVAPGSRSDALIEYSDVLPTFIDIAGGAPVNELDGFTFVPVLKGNTSTHKSFSYGIMTTRGINGGSEYFPIRSINDGRYRLIVNYAPEASFHNNSEMPGWEQSTDPWAMKRVDQYRHRPALELYDDVHDVWNMTNLANQPGDDSIKTLLSGKLSEWMKKVGDDPMQTELTAFEHMDKPPFNGDSVIVIQAPLPATVLRNRMAGIRYAMYNGAWTALPDFASLTPARRGTVANFDETASLPGRTGDRYAVRYTGHVHAQTKGFHTFYLNTFNPASLAIDGATVVESSAEPAAKTPVRRYGCVSLDTGWHAITVSFLGYSAKDSLSVTWSYPGLIEAVGNLKIPDNALTSGDPVSTGGNRSAIPAPGWIRMIGGNTLTLSPSLRGGEVLIHDALGALAQRRRNAARIDLSALPSNAYVVQIWLGGRLVALGRFVKP